MAQTDPTKFPFQGQVDVRTGMAHALAEYMKTLSFSSPSKVAPFSFADVFIRWADFQQRAKSAGGLIPIAAVLPERGLDADSMLAPAEMTDTWDGAERGGGFALVKFAEYECTMTVLVRARSDVERQSIVNTLEKAFVEVNGDFQRNCLVLTMDRHFGRKVRFSLVAQEIVANESLAEEMRWLHYFEIEAQAPRVQPFFFPALRPRIRVVSDGLGDNR